MKNKSKKVGLRAVLASVLAATILMTSVVMASAATKSVANVFKDVEAGKWYTPAVQYVYDAKLFKGTSKDTFSLKANMTRAMFVTVLGRAAGVKEADYKGKTSFTDVKAGKWYSAYVEWAFKNGIVDGVGRGKFNPNGFITRQEMAKILAEYYNSKSIGKVSNPNALDKFTDKDKIASWAKEGMRWCVTNGVFEGSNNNLLNPVGSAMRSECAKVFFESKDLKSYETEPDDTSSKPDDGDGGAETSNGDDGSEETETSNGDDGSGETETSSGDDESSY